MHFDVPRLPDEALAAAAAFHGEVLDLIEVALLALHPLPLGRGEGEGAANAGSTVSHHANPDLPPGASERREGEGLTLVFPDSQREHRGWRLAAVQGLARKHAPLRINAIEGGDAPAREAMIAWLNGAGAITGQLLALEATA